MNVIEEVETLTLRELEEQSDTSLFVVNNTQPRGKIKNTIQDLKDPNLS